MSSVTEDIRARLDIVEYVQRYVPIKKAGRYYKAPCPFHTERTPSFVVNPDTQSWRCFGACAEGGDVFSFAMKLHGWDFRDALRELGQLVGVDVTPRTPEQRTQDDRAEQLRGVLGGVADMFHADLFNADNPDATAALRYAREKRGLTDATLRAFGIGYAPRGWQTTRDRLLHLGYSEADLLESGLCVRGEKTGELYDRFRHRLLVPIRDRKGRVVGFGARALDPDDTPKYLNSPQSAVFDKSQLLFGLDRAAQSIRDSGTVVIVEGYMDVIQAHQAGFTNVVAQMGTALTETQLKLVAPRLAERIVLALDSDAAGQNATRRSLDVARATLEADYAGRLAVDMRVLQSPGAKDPDDLIRETPDAWADLVATAVPVADYVIETTAAALPPNATINERQAAARDVLPLLTASENNLYSSDNLQKLALRLRLPERELLTWAEAQRPAKRAPKPARTEPATPPAPSPAEHPDAPMMQSAPSLPFGVGGTRTAAPAHESYCLHLLLHHPDQYYTANRQLRATAGTDEALFALLGPLDADDFTDRALQTLMRVFLEANAQDELTVLDYVRTQTGGESVPVLEGVLAERLPAQLSRGMDISRGDVRAVLRAAEQRRAVPPQQELTEWVLRVRLQRLVRETDELMFLQQEAETNGDTELLGVAARKLVPLTRARRQLEAALRRHVARL